MRMIQPQLIDKYLRGTASPEEIAAVNAWLTDENADLDVLRRYLDAHWDGETAEVDEDTDRRMLAAFRERLYPGLSSAAQQTAAPASGSREENKALFRRLHRWQYVAAACLVPLLIWGTVLLYRQTVSSGRSMAWVRLSNTDSNVRTYTLPDGSRVWLSPGGCLSYPDGFGRSQRDVSLTGEAFLNIAIDASHPFTVHAGHVRTTVLGTAFNIEAYEDEKIVRISLISGKVAVQAETGTEGDWKAAIVDSVSQQELLLPGDMLSMERNTGTIQRQRLPDTDAAAYTKGYMIFNDIPLADALQRIARRYHLQVRYAAGLRPADSRITTVLKDAPLDELTHLLPFVAPYQCSIRNKVLYVDTR